MATQHFYSPISNGMDVWPSGGSQTKPVIDSDCESDTPVTKIHRRNDNTAGGYPLYEGGLTSANLWSEKGRLKWTFLSEEIPGISRYFSRSLITHIG